MNLRETILDDEQFRQLSNFFVCKASEPEEGDDPDFLRFYKSALDVITNESANAIIRFSGREKTAPLIYTN